jgi:hypothetical protein
VTHGPFTCSTHTVTVTERGGVEVVGDITGISSVKWNRIRDDISHAEITVQPQACCELLGDLRTVLHELHIYSNGDPVWEGPITRLEYDYDEVRIFAEDMLFVPKRKVLGTGYDYRHPNIGNAIDHMFWLLWEQCFVLDGDPWAMNGHVIAHHHAGDPRTSRQVFAWQMYVWEDLDKYAEDYGADYCVVGRDIHVFDTHLAWSVLPLIDAQHISQFPRIVEYGNEVATRGIVTNSKGYAGQAIASPWPHPYTTIDLLTNNNLENAEDDEVPTAEDLAQWAATATRSLDGRTVAPVGIVVPANSTLMPGAPWTIDDLIPGSWCQVTSSTHCRTLTEWQRLHEVVVSESAPDGEMVQVTTVSPPSTRVDP